MGRFSLCKGGGETDASGAVRSLTNPTYSFRSRSGGFPDALQRTFRSINRVVIREWQSRDVVIGFRALARETAKQIPLATAGISSDHAEIVAGTDVLVCHTSGDDNHVSRIHLDVLAVLAPESQSGSARIHTQHFMRRAVIMGKGIDTVSPRVGPVVLSKTLLENRSGIFGVGPDRASIEQQGQGTIWENTIVLEIQLLRLNKILLLDHKRYSSSEI